MNPIMNQKEYEELRKEIINWLPKKIIDCHVHTPLILYNKPNRPFSKNLLKIYRQDRKIVTKKDFKYLYPKKDFSFFGFPLPYLEAVPEKVNRDILKQDIGVFLLDDELEHLEAAITKKVIGLKAHWKLRNKAATFNDIIDEGKCEFLEKNKLILLIEVSNPPENFDILKNIDKSYNFNIILPHMAFNHKGFTVTKKVFDKAFKNHNKKFNILNKLSDTDHIFLDVAMVVNYDLIKTGIELLGSEKILFGTDFPFALTPKIEEEREDMGKEEFFGCIRNILQGKKHNKNWLFYKNIYLLLWLVKKACEKLDIDKELIFHKNANRIRK